MKKTQRRLIKKLIRRFEKLNESIAELEKEMSSSVDRTKIAADPLPTPVAPVGNVGTSVNHVTITSDNITQTSARVIFSFDPAAPGRLRYWPVSDPSNVQLSTAELSSISTHAQTLSGLLSGQEYVVRSQTIGDDGSTWVDVSPEYNIQLATASMGNDNNAGRIAFWSEPANGGYDVAWEATPTMADVGRTAEDWFNDEEWSNGQPVIVSTDYQGTAQVALAPDGTPAIQVILPAGQEDGINFRGTQLGTQSGILDAVYSAETWTGDTAADNTARSYFGFGHFMWSNGTQFSSGGNNTPNGGSARGTIASGAVTNGNDATYLYGCGNAGTGDSRSVGRPHTFGEWVLNELEIKLNPVGNSANGGSTNHLINGQSELILDPYHLRCLDDVFHFGAACFVHHNNDAPVLQRYWIKNWRIYV